MGSSGGPADIPLIKRSLQKAMPPSPLSSGDNAAEGSTLSRRPALPSSLSSSSSSSSSQPLAQHQLHSTATSNRASTLRRERHLNGKTSTGKQAWRAASTSSTLHLPPYKNHIVLYHNTQQAKYHEALARYQTRLAHIQLSRRFKKPGPNSAAIYQSRSDIQSLTYKVLSINPSSANTKSRAYYLQKADISRYLYTSRILNVVSSNSLNFLPALPPSKLGLTLSDSQDLARQLISLTSEEAEDDRSSAVKQLAAFSQLFARVIQGEQADPFFRLNVKSITHLASTAEAPQPPRPPISGPERIATHA